MPEQYIAEIKIRNLHEGDVIKDWAFAANDQRPTGKITEHTPKDKFTYFKVEGDVKQYRFAHDCMAKVERERLTPDELEDQRRERMVLIIDDFETRYEFWRNDIRKSIGERLAAGYDISHFDYDKLHRYDAQWEIWREVQRVHEAVTLRLVFDGPIKDRDEVGDMVTITEFTRHDAVLRVAKRLKKRFFQSARFVNSSTSSMSNLVDAYQYEAWKDFLHEVEDPFGQLGRYGG